MADQLRAKLKRNQTLIMGVVNTTPDSFSDGGKFLDPNAALKHGLDLVEQGADILDVGGESTRPGAKPVSVEQELDRVLPVIESLAAHTATPISIDTSKPDVMAAALEAGAVMINDVNALQTEGAIEIAAHHKALVCLMHMQGQPRSMQVNPQYHDVVAQVTDFLNQRIKACNAAGIQSSDIIVDPGIGFGKQLEHNLSLLAAIDFMRSQTGCELLIGVSRKSMIDKILGRPVEKRVAASVGLAVQAALNGAKIVRVHDVADSFDAIRCAEAVAHAK